MFPSSNRSLSCDNIAQQARDAESQQKTGKEIPHAHAQAGEGSHNGAPEETSRVHLDHPPPAKPPSVWKNRKNRSVSWDDLPAQINSMKDAAMMAFVSY
ncbi:hypothetical protein GUITHDRAFT_113455 [Guillardia theta CCMP2712]|uniref:Uncharacterized protein n=1 Tax=Guillardia theta (strain CCMP2712) TaxID=905079 RepID=L1IW13_GUITC|nr:hypothetical protein GUITHDRAFT_113455 [Guillardia theta CCMP2712]EKX40426.1 hypothetical protein GUITHDRAFT_113455 [Guillardia theta CCMP2712]|eukprot:XP_005827406.1 hypothetical protein GUITHDRAFT_113455 [Guillardia theta CCMP2712]